MHLRARAWTELRGLLVLRYDIERHLIEDMGLMLSRRILEDAELHTLTTVNGQTIEVDVTGSWIKRVTLIDKAPTRDPMVIVPNVRAANGIAHAIDRVLIPTIVG